MNWILATLLLTTSYTWQDQVKEIDQVIQELEGQKESYRRKAQKNTNNAMRWQFQRNNYMDARRAWDKVVESKQKMVEIQDQIDDLKARKKVIIKKHGKTS